MWQGCWGSHVVAKKEHGVKIFDLNLKIRSDSRATSCIPPKVNAALSTAATKGRPPLQINRRAYPAHHAEMSVPPASVPRSTAAPPHTARSEELPTNKLAAAATSMQRAVSTSKPQQPLRRADPARHEMMHISPSSVPSSAALPSRCSGGGGGGGRSGGRSRGRGRAGDCGGDGRAGAGAGARAEAVIKDGGWEQGRWRW